MRHLDNITNICIKTDHHDLTELLLKVALNTIKPNQSYYNPVIDKNITQRNELGSDFLVRVPVPNEKISLTSDSFWLILIDLILVFNATFSNISAISWRPVLVLEEARVPGKIRTTDPGQATGKLYHLRLQAECTLFL